MKQYLSEIVKRSLAGPPEDMLKTALKACVELAGATGGSILGEEGPSLQFLFCNREDLIGRKVPFDSIAGTSLRKGLVILTHAPSDKRHYAGVDQDTKASTHYLLSIPIPSVMMRSGDADERYSAVLQLLFDNLILPSVKEENLPVEITFKNFADINVLGEKFEQLLYLLPLIEFGMEIIRIRQTSYQVIHELKNKLISGRSWLNYLRDDVEAASPGIIKEQIAEDFDLTESSMSEGAELAKSYLQFTKIYNPEFVDIDLASILKEVAASAKAFARENGDNVRVVENHSVQSKNRRLDPAQMKMAIFNLCKNAIEAMAGREGAVLTISLTEKDSGATIDIEDNGPGMPPEIAEALFIAFKTKKEGGTGLGLTICKKIVEINGGLIECKTGQAGTKFTITFPASSGG